MNRRSFLSRNCAALGAAALPFADRWLTPAGAAGTRFRYAICNEMFEKQDFAKSCRAMKAAGYSGIEIAPFTLADHLDELSPARRRELRDIIRSEGLEFAGLHWLLITPKWLHVTTSDQSIRRKSWDYMPKLIDFCADLGKGIMVFGSPKQRGSQGNTPAEARRLLAQGLASVAQHAGERGVTILIEPLPKKDTDVVNTTDDAVRMVNEINHPGIQTMFDFHNTLDETEPLDALVRRYFKYIRHVHVNEMDGRHPGTGSFNFVPVFKTLAELRYPHWISLEIFEWKVGPAKCARDAMTHLLQIEKKL
jgi:sugar phosphate isomerase/epimerase